MMILMSLTLIISECFNKNKGKECGIEFYKLIYKMEGI